MTRYVEILDPQNSKEPQGENIAIELDKEIAEIEQENDVQLVTFAFLGIADVPKEGEEDSLMCFAIRHDKVHKYMLHFC